MSQHSRAHQALNRWVLLALAAVSATAGLSAPAAAQDEPPAEAVGFYESGRQHFAAGEYREAAVDLERALMLDPGSVTLLFNLARVYELMGELDRSISFYQRYLRMLPEDDGEERERVARTLRRLEGARDRAPTRTEPETAPEVVAPIEAPPTERVTEQPQDRQAGVADATFWIVASAAAAALVGGGIAGAMALSKQQEARDFVVGSAGNTVERGDRVVDAKNLALTADILFSVGAVGAVTALLLYVLRSETADLDRTEGTRPVVSADGTRLWVGLRGGF